MVESECSITGLRNDERALQRYKRRLALPDEGRGAYGTLEKAVEAFDGSGMLCHYGLHTDHKSLLTARKGPGRSVIIT